MNNINKLLIFTAGVAIGVAASWKFFENKYKKIAQEEIDSVKEVFSKREKERTESTEETPEDDPEFSKEEVEGYSNIIKNLGYSTEEKGGVVMKRPYVISPEEFGENDEYGTETLMYFADGVLTDDFDNPIEDVEAMVGEDSLDHFGEYEDDSVFVRNDNHKIDYEILKDERNYSDIPKRTPYTVDD